MKLLYNGAILLYVPSHVIKMNRKNVIFQLFKNSINKDPLYNVYNVNNIILDLEDTHDFIYKFNLQKIDNTVYYLKPYDLNKIYSMTLHSNQFIANL